MWCKIMSWHLIQKWLSYQEAVLELIEIKRNQLHIGIILKGHKEHPEIKMLKVHNEHPQAKILKGNIEQPLIEVQALEYRKGEHLWI
jgi:hypothetical protein